MKFIIADRQKFTKEQCKLVMSRMAKDTKVVMVNTSDIVVCDHCGDKVPIEKAHKTEWKEYNIHWHYCNRCETKVFGGGKHE